MEAPGGSAIPVEAILKLIVDRSGEESVKKVLEDQDSAFSKVEQTVGRIGTQMEGIGRTVADLAGVAGVGALLDKFVKVETSASNVALSMGKVTGGFGSYHGIGQEMLGVQAKTGVSVSEQEGALRALAMSVGLNPKPGQTGMLAEVIAGYSKSTGMPASVLGSILGPMLQAEGRTSSPSAVAYTMGEARANLGAFPGSQIESVLPGISALTTQQGYGAALSGHKASVGNISALVNTLASDNPMFHGQAGVEAAGEIAGGFASASKNQVMMMIARKAGMTLMQTHEATNHPQAEEKAINAVMEMAPGPQNEGTRLMLYEQMFGEKGALGAIEIERHIAKGERGIKPKVAPAHAGIPLANLQAETTPESELSKIQGAIEKYAYANPIQAGVVGIGALGGVQALAGAAVPLAAAGGLAYGAAQGLSGLGKDLGKLGLPYSTRMPLESLMEAPALGFHELLKNPVTAITRSLHGWENILGLGGGAPKPPSLKTSLESDGGFFAPSSPTALAKAAIQTAEKEYGPGWWHDSAGGEKSNQTIRSLLEGKTPFVGKGGPKLSESAGGKAGGEALVMTDKVIKEQREYSEKGAQGFYTEKFGAAVEKFAKAVGTGAGTKTASYGGGGAMHDASLTGAAGIASLDSTVPGLVMASFLKKGATPGTAPSPSGPGTVPASYSPGSTSSAWNAVLEKYSNSEYGKKGYGDAQQYIGMLGSGGPSGGTRRQEVEAAAKKAGIPFSVLWGIYGAESSYGKHPDNFGLLGSQDSGSFGTQAQTSIADLKAIAKEMNLHVHVEVGGSKVEQHKVKIGAGSQRS